MLSFIMMLQRATWPRISRAAYDCHFDTTGYIGVKNIYMRKTSGYSILDQLVC